MADLKNRIISESSYPDVLAQLLFEEVEDAAKAVSVAQKAFQTRNTQLASLVNSLPAGKYKDGLSAFVESVEEGTEQASGRVDSIDTEDDSAPDQVAVVSKSYDQLNKTIKQVLDVNLALMQNLAKTIVDSKLHQGGNKDIPMAQILEESELLDTAKKELSDAFDKAGVKPIKKPKGFLAKIFGNAFGETEEAVELANQVVEQKDSLIDSILEMSPIEIGKFAQAIVNYGKTDESAASKIETATDTAVEESGSDNVEPDGGATPNDGDQEDGEAKSISRKDLIDKVKNNPLLGDGGAMVLDRIIDTGLFDDLGIKLSESLRKRNMSVLLEKQLAADEFQAAYDLAAEEDPDKLKDTSPVDVASELNDIFSEENIDIQIEEPEPVEELTGEDADLTPQEVEETEQVADEVEKALGSLPFKKLQLAKILKNFPEITGKGDKATKQRRAFRKAINQAAGQEIFEEGKKLEEDEELMARVRKLAGIL